MDKITADKEVRAQRRQNKKTSGYVSNIIPRIERRRKRKRVDYSKMGGNLKGTLVPSLAQLDRAKSKPVPRRRKKARPKGPLDLLRV